MKERSVTFLADESCDFAVVRALRAAGYSVEAICELSPGMPDEAVLALAVKNGRLLLTEDKDFGEWIYAHEQAMAGVLLIRYPANTRAAMVKTIVDLIEQHGEDLTGSYTVLEPGRARIRKK